MTRLSALSEEQLTPEAKAVYDAISAGPRGGMGLVGPFGVYVRAPKVGNAAQELGAAARFGTEVGENAKEVAICVVGAFYKAKFEFAAHATLAKKAGVDDAVVEAIRVGDTPVFAKDEERLAYAVATENLNNKRVSSETYEAAVACFGEKQLIELTLTIGYYSLVSITLNTFEIPLREGMSDPYPDWS
ncbi:MAG: carboxymuconolactone decarboxylase family protein [Gammaproteobacteria bacterium]|nr:carboxymuconolactone decarboxylase family protein [Gammaproteobacteria bacterium]